MSPLKWGDLLIGVLVIFPLLVAGPALFDAQASTPGVVLDRLGHASGILGLSLLFAAAALSVRLPRLDRWFGGLTRLWKLHHLLGLGSFLLLLLHPLLLAFSRVPISVGAAVEVLFPARTDWAVMAGWLALLALMAFLAPTFAFFGKPGYQRWKRLHLLAGIALAGAVAHVQPLDYSFPGIRAMAWEGLAAMALAAFVYRALLARYLGRRRYIVSAVSDLAPGVVELRLRAEGRLLDYSAGQFVYVSLDDPDLPQGRGEEHPFSLSSGPGETELRITIKDLGDATHAFQTVRVGSRASIEGPYGAFFAVAPSEQPELWIAGGIGISPFMARARQLRRKGANADIHLFYCTDARPQAYYLSELQEIADKVPGMRVWFHYLSQSGPLSLEYIAGRCPDFAVREIYLCGPAPLVGGLRRQFRRHRIPRARLHSEEFTFL